MKYIKRFWFITILGPVFITYFLLRDLLCSILEFSSECASTVKGVLKGDFDNNSWFGKI